MTCESDDVVDEMIIISPTLGLRDDVDVCSDSALRPHDLHFLRHDVNIVAAVSAASKTKRILKQLLCIIKIPIPLARPPFHTHFCSVMKVFREIIGRNDRGI